MHLGSGSPDCSCSSDSAASGCAKRCARTAPLPRSRRLTLRSWSSSRASVRAGSAGTTASTGRSTAPVHRPHPSAPRRCMDRSAERRAAPFHRGRSEPRAERRGRLGLRKAAQRSPIELEERWVSTSSRTRPDNPFRGGGPAAVRRGLGLRPCRGGGRRWFGRFASRFVLGLAGAGTQRGCAADEQGGRERGEADPEE
jgi:hypothetical protein